MIHVAHGIHDKDGEYARHLCATMESYLSNTQSEICIHILHDDTLTAGNEKIIKKIAGKHGSNVEFHRVELRKENDIDLNKITRDLTIGTLFRLILPDLLPDVDKVIYLDLDIICTLDLQSLWDVDIAECCIGAVADSQTYRQRAKNMEFYKKVPIMGNKYFNAGVIVFNLCKIRNSHKLFMESVNFLSAHKDAPCVDQDALNYIFQAECKMLDSKFNFIADDIFLHKENALSQQELQRLYDGRVWHFAGEDKPWFSKRYPVFELYWKYFAQTSWGDTPENLAKWMFKIESGPLDELMLTHRIISRKRFIVNFAKRFVREVCAKYIG